MRTVPCNFCGNGQYEERRIEYLCSHKGKYLLVPNTPVEICLNGTDVQIILVLSISYLIS